MINLLQDFPIKAYNTFGISVKTKYFACCTSLNALTELCSAEMFQKGPHLVMGGGSNMLFTKDFEGLIVQPALKGISILDGDERHVKIKAMAGENWDDLVAFAVEHGFGGLENLSLIPGTVGSSPIQNIGAYGVEVKDRIDSVEVLNLETNRVDVLSNKDCAFAYRESIFKKALKHKVIVLSVTFSLDLEPTFVTSYGNVEQELAGFPEINLATIREGIIAIRRKKLPDPQVTGNAGSFFKNPVITAQSASRLKKKYIDMPGYPQADGSIKVPAAWMIEQCGWKGFRQGDAGVHPNQPLVLVNYGTATGLEIASLAEHVRKSVLDKFGVHLEFEVNII